MKSIVDFCIASIMLLTTIKAATIIGSFNPSQPGLESIDLTSEGSLNWATLEIRGFANTKAGGSDAFSNIALVRAPGGARSSLWTGIDASTLMSWTDGSPTVAASGYRNFAFSFGWDLVGAGISFDYTLEAPVVNMTIYLIDFDGWDRPIRPNPYRVWDPRWAVWESQWAPWGNNTNLFTASLSSGATFSQIVTLTDGFDSDHGKGWFDLTVSGSVGDVITISHILDKDDRRPGTNVGIQAVTVRAVPEPGTTFLGLISFCLTMRRRRSI